MDRGNETLKVGEINRSPKRLRILGDEERETLYGRPCFTPEDRIEYFSVSALEKAALEPFHSLKSRVCFMLQLGYFKARRLFFAFDLHEVAADARYICEQYFPDCSLTDGKVTKITRLNQQRVILELCRYRSCGSQHRRQLEATARQAATVCAKPIFVFRKLLNCLEEDRVVIPGYSLLQDTVGKALTYEQNRLTILMRDALTPCDREALKRLLENTAGLYEITQLKRQPKDFSAREIKREIHRGEHIGDLSLLAQRLLPKLGISNENIKYYASLVGYYSVHRLKQLNEWMVYAYLLCFVSTRSQRLHDHLIDCLIHKIRRYTEEAKRGAKEQVYEFRIEENQNLHKAGQVLKLFTDDSIAPNTPFQSVQTSAFDILERRKLDFIADHIATSAQFDETAFQWNHVDKLAHQFKLHVRPILQTVEFASVSAQSPLMKALDFLKAAFHKNKSLGQYRSDAFPTRFVPKRHEGLSLRTGCFRTKTTDPGPIRIFSLPASASWTGSRRHLLPKQHSLSQS